MAQESMKAIICQVGNEEYALKVSDVLSIERMQNIRSLPHAEAYIAGIMHLRGMVLPVMDLRIWLGVSKSAEDDQEHKRIIVTESGEKRLGLIVDAATDVFDIEEKQIQTVDIRQGAEEVKQVVNLDGRLILILNVPKLIGQLDSSIFEVTETVK